MPAGAATAAAKRPFSLSPTTASASGRSRFRRGRCKRCQSELLGAFDLQGSQPRSALSYRGLSPRPLPQKMTLLLLFLPVVPLLLSFSSSLANARPSPMRNRPGDAAAADPSASGSREEPLKPDDPPTSGKDGRMKNRSGQAPWEPRLRPSLLSRRSIQRIPRRSCDGDGTSVVPARDEAAFRSSAPC